MKGKSITNLKKSLNLFLLPLFFVSILILGSLHANAASGVYVNSTNFPDEVFRNWVINNCDITKSQGKDYVTTDALEAVTVIDLNGQSKLKNLKGIEYFTNLKKLTCMQTGISSIDLSKNTKLEELVCTNSSNLTSLNLSGNPNLKILKCQVNNLSSLNLSKNTKLEELNCRGNKITSLDLSGNPNLKKLECYNNQISSLNLQKCTKLTYLACYTNELKSLDLSNNTSLKELYCENNEIASIDVTKCKSLAYLDCSGNNLKSINLDENVNLVSLLCYNNKLTSLSVNNIHDIKEVYCYKNSISVFRIDMNGVLKENIKKATRTELSDKTIQYTVNNEVTLWIDKSAVIAEVTNNKQKNEENKVDEKAVREFVSRLYYIALERTEIDQAGLDNWTNNLIAKKISGGQVGFEFITSQEFKNKNYSDEVFVEKMYKVFLGRDSDPQGKENWMKALKNNQSRESVAAGFANSVEFENICKDYGIDRGTVNVSNNNNQNNNQNQNQNNNQNHSYFVIGTSNVNQENLDAYIDRLYQEVLGRKSDAAGKEYWRKGILEGKDYDAVTVARIGFFSSPEYLSKKKSDEEFIIDAYHAFLGREPDKAGFENWKKQLQENNMSREYMLDIGFGNSKEFKGILESYGFKVTVIQ